MVQRARPITMSWVVGPSPPVHVPRMSGPAAMPADAKAVSSRRLGDRRPRPPGRTGVGHDGIPDDVMKVDQRLIKLWVSVSSSSTNQVLNRRPPGARVRAISAR